MTHFTLHGLILIILLYFPFSTNKQNQMAPYAKVGLEEALNKLSDSGTAYQEYFEHGSMRVGMYGPVEADRQQPHDQDELYVIAIGTGKFEVEGVKYSFKAGDVFFVAAHTEHRFIEFSKDFKTWVFFYGPEGGESDTE